MVALDDPSYLSAISVAAAFACVASTDQSVIIWRPEPRGSRVVQRAHSCTTAPRGRRLPSIGGRDLARGASGLENPHECMSRRNAIGNSCRTTPFSRPIARGSSMVSADSGFDAFFTGGDIIVKSPVTTLTVTQHRPASRRPRFSCGCHRRRVKREMNGVVFAHEFATSTAPRC